MIHNNMNGQNSDKNDSTLSKSTVTSTPITTQLDSIDRRRYIAQNFILLWLDINIDQPKQDCQDTLAQLRSIINHVNIYTKCDECINFLTENKDIKTFLIVENSIGQQIVPLIHDLNQLHAISVFCNNNFEHEQWTQKWTKVKGVHTEITSICELLRATVEQCDQDVITMSFIPVHKETSIQNLDQLEPTFMYTQIFKEILLNLEYDRQSVKDFITYCRTNDYGSPINITRFENEYDAKSAVWWYTFPSFIYSMLNNALRLLEADIIIKMGFFIHDLHYQIEQMYKNQIDDYHGQPFIVYRGQGLSKTDFPRLLKAKGGLMSFNNFLSTSKNEDISLGFAKGASTNTHTVGILFKISINPSVSTAPFASIREVSYFKKEEEILFSMHTIFRIGEIIKIDNTSSIYQVDLQLTVDDDEQLRLLTNYIREETASETAWGRLGVLLVKIGQLNKAEELFTTLLEQTSDENEIACYYNNLGYVQNIQGNYKIAISFYEKALEVNRKILPANHPNLAVTYNNIGSIYHNMERFSKALIFYEKALGIREKTLSSDHPVMASSYNNIGGVYNSMGDYANALSFYEKAGRIMQKTLPLNYPLYATSFNNIGSMYDNMGDYPEALSFYKKALEIRKKTLPPNHPVLATSYNNIGGVYNNMGDYSKALNSYENVLRIRENILPPNHPDFTDVYMNICLMHQNMGEYKKALSYAERALNIKQKTIPQNHPDLAASYNNIGTVFKTMGDSSKALLYFERALDIHQRSLPANHPAIENVRKCIEHIKKKL